MTDLISSARVLESGMKAQSARLSIISQNIANKDSTALTPGGDPYRRKTIYFHGKFNKELGTDIVNIAKYGHDYGNFKMRLQPSHPAANSKGYVLYPKR